MFNLLPGQGLGFTGSKEIAFGLDPVVSGIIVKEVTASGGIVHSNWRHVPWSPRPSRKPRYKAPSKVVEKITVLDNAYSVKANDDKELFEILQIIFEVIE